MSVRDENEFTIAAESGVDIIDLKEPARGPLAPVDPDLWKRIAASGSRQPRKLSAALGEPPQALACAHQLPPAFDFAKAGPSGCRTKTQLTDLWHRVANQLSRETELVAVAYADAPLADCLDLEFVLEAASAAGMRRCLVDTFTKDGRSSLTHLGLHRLAQFDQEAKDAGIWWALAGSITTDDLAALWDADISPHCVAVRGDACEGARHGTLCKKRLRAWRQLLAK